MRNTIDATLQPRHPNKLTTSVPWTGLAGHLYKNNDYNIGNFRSSFFLPDCDWLRLTGCWFSQTFIYPDPLSRGPYFWRWITQIVVYHRNGCLAKLQIPFISCTKPSHRHHLGSDRIQNKRPSNNVPLSFSHSIDCPGRQCVPTGLV